MVVVVSETFQHLLAGTTAGLVSTAALYPLELVKTRMQVMDGSNQAYRTMRSSLQMVLKHEGFGGFYKGMSPALFAASGSWGGYFYFYELSKKRKTNNGTRALTTSDHLLSGVEAGSILVFIFNPFWVIKTRLALQGSETGPHKQYTGMINAFLTISREEGLRGLYKGLVPALFLTSHGAIQFAVYESMKKVFKNFRSEEDKNRQPAFVSALLGGGSKIIASTATYPYQVIKSRLQQRDSIVQDPQMGNTKNLAPKYNGMIDCIVKMWRNEGILGFFRGVIPNALKVAPAAALTFLIYEESMHLLKQAT